MGVDCCVEAFVDDASCLGEVNNGAVCCVEGGKCDCCCCCMSPVVVFVRKTGASDCESVGGIIVAGGGTG